MFLTSETGLTFPYNIPFHFLNSITKKRAAELGRDETEFQKFMALEFDPEEHQRIDALRC